jgi:hypothetical protein
MLRISIEKLKVEVKLGGNSLSDADLQGTN